MKGTIYNLVTWPQPKSKLGNSYWHEFEVIFKAKRGNNKRSQKCILYSSTYLEKNRGTNSGNISNILIEYTILNNILRDNYNTH